MSNRRHAEGPRWLGWFGDLVYARQFLQAKPWLSWWGVAKTVNAVLRSFGVVAFANNPLTGALILIGMFAGNPMVGCAALLAGVVSVICSKLLGAPDGLVCDGVTAFNSVLVGCVCTAVVPDTLGSDVTSALYWLALLGAFVVTCYVDLGLNTLMAPTGLPAQSIAFNVVAAVAMLAARGRLVGYGLHDVNDAQVGQDIGNHLNLNTYNETIAPSVMNGTTESFDSGSEVDWFQVMRGTVLAAGQVYGVGSITPSILIWLGFTAYSPILAVCFYIGSVIGTMMGSVLAPPSLMADVYAGLWGYNSLLTAGGLSYFLQPSLHMLVAVMIGALMAVVAQAALLPIFLPTQVPVFSYPFNVVITVILAIGTQQGTVLTFLADRSYPEKHAFDHYTRRYLERKRGDPDVEISLRNGHP